MFFFLNETIQYVCFIVQKKILLSFQLLSQISSFKMVMFVLKEHGTYTQKDQYFQIFSNI